MKEGNITFLVSLLQLKAPQRNILKKEHGSFALTYKMNDAHKAPLTPKNYCQTVIGNNPTTDKRYLLLKKKEKKF